MSRSAKHNFDFLARRIYSYGFYISKLNDLKVIYDLYS
jgi:hypothetical protein